MNGGKSTLLLQTAFSSRSREFEVIIVGYKRNTREKTIKSRLGVEYDADLLYDSTTRLRTGILRQLAKKGRHKVLEVLVDEAQFLTPKQVEDLLKFTIESGIDVKCFGLKTNFETKLFPGSQRLIELADELVELNLVRCRCGKKANINARFNPTTRELIIEGPEELIEGSVEEVIYDPVCSRCYIEHGGKLSSS